MVYGRFGGQSFLLDDFSQHSVSMSTEPFSTVGCAVVVARHLLEFFLRSGIGGTADT